MLNKVRNVFLLNLSFILIKRAITTPKSFPNTNMVETQTKFFKNKDEHLEKAKRSLSTSKNSSGNSTQNELIKDIQKTQDI